MVPTLGTIRVVGCLDLVKRSKHGHGHRDREERHDHDMGYRCAGRLEYELVRPQDNGNLTP